MPVVVVGISHHSTPVTVREQFAFEDKMIPETLHQLRAQGIASEGVILSTCNRVEIYAYTEQASAESAQSLRRFLLNSRNLQEPPDGDIYTLTEPKSLEHLFKVASGLDSMVLGETEILGQLKKSYQLALENKFTGTRLNKIFQKAFNVAKQIRSETNIQRGSISVGSVAVELAEKIFSELDQRQVMIIGAGDTSEKTARALLSRGAHSVIVSNRSYDRAHALAVQLGGQAVHFEDWAEHFHQIDIVISSTAAPHYILDRARLEPLMRRRRNSPILLIDIAVPRDIDPEVNFLEHVFLYNIDDLQAIAEDYLKQRQEEVAKCEDIIRRKAREWTETSEKSSWTGGSVLTKQKG